MSYLWPILGIALAIILIIKREVIGDTFGEAEWTQKIGGVHALIVYIALFIMIWSIASLTGTTDMLFKPFLLLFPTLTQRGGAEADMMY